MSNNKQTAVEWYSEQDTLATIDFIEKKISQLELAIKKATILQQAKEMEKQQIVESFKHGEMPKLFSNLSAKQYYEQEYGKETDNN